MASPAEPVGLTVEAIIDRAVKLLDEGGLARFSIRALARDLGVNANALVWHVENRDNLLSLIADRVLSGIEIVESTLPWEQRLRAIARNYRAAVRSHPAVSALLTTQLSSNSGGQVGALEMVMSTLHEAGLRDAALVDSSNAIVGAVVGFVGVELATPPTEGAEAWQSAVRSGFDELDEQDFPMVTAHRAALENRSFVYRWSSGIEQPLDQAFERLLDLVVAGVASVRN